MADNDTGKVILDDKERAAHNAGVAQTQKDQDISGKGTAPLDFSHTISALDSLRDSVVAKKKEAANVDELGELVKPAEEAAVPASDDSSKTSDDNAAIKAAEDARLADEAAKAVEKQAADEFFKDSPALPPNASPKSSEAFASVKRHAAQEMARLKAELEKATAEASELRERTAEAITPEVKQELESLREFRLRLDIETDPKFKEFDKGISSAHEFIYAQLKKSPAISDDVIAKIKSLGGPENVRMDDIFAAVKDPMIQRLVEAKLADVELAKYNKDQAIAATKANTGKYLEERQKQWEASASSHNTRTKAELDGLISRVDWLNPIVPAANADAAAKKAVEVRNEQVKSIRKEIDAAMGDDSPQMRATLLVGMAQLFRLQAAQEGIVKERDAFKKELAEARSTVARLTSASTSRVRESAAPASGAPVKKEIDIFNTRAGDALDQIRAAKAAAQNNT